MGGSSPSYHLNFVGKKGHDIALEHTRKVVDEVFAKVIQVVAEALRRIEAGRRRLGGEEIDRHWCIAGMTVRPLGHSYTERKRVPCAETRAIGR